jgi:hypothetical protein
MPYLIVVTTSLFATREPTIESLLEVDHETIASRLGSLQRLDCRGSIHLSAGDADIW